VISSDFYSVYTSAGKKADGLVNLFCWAHYPDIAVMPIRGCWRWRAGVGGLAVSA